MAKYVLAADYTLMTDYRNVPLATFFSCIPTDYWQSRLVFRILADQPKLDAQGRPIRVPYGLRKVEASLVRAFGRDDVVIADPRDVDRYIDDETEVVGLHSMDPLGLGPVSMSFTMGGVLTPYTKAMFLELVKRVQRPNRKYKVVLGGPGAWHFDYRQEMQESLGIDHIVHGEVDHLVPEIFDRIVNDSAPPVMRFTNATAPTVDQIPKILGPTMHAMNEVMRGCGRGCEFCEVTLRRPRYFPFDYIGDEIAVNTKVGQSSIQLHSDDIFLYNLENWKTMEPNEDAVKDLFRFVMAQPGVSHCYPTHGTVSAAVTNPGLIRDISEIVRAGPNKWVGIQSGIETGSPALSRAVLHRKAAPFTAEEWPDLVVEGTQILNRNYWYPAFTIILGLPGETPEDAWMTVDLLDRMEQIPNSHFITAPLTFVPIGVLRGEEFYNIDEMIDESRFNVAYRAWRHVLLEIDQDLWQLTRLPPPTRALVVATGRIGGRYILGIMHRYARRMGFRIRAPAKTRRQAEGHTLSFPATRPRRALGSGSREAQCVAFCLAARLRRRSDSEAHSPGISVHDSEDVPAADSSRGDHQGSRRRREASELPKVLVDLEEDVAPCAVCHVEARLVDHFVDVVELLAPQHADRHERERRRDEVAVRNLLHPVEEVHRHPRILRSLTRQTEDDREGGIPVIAV